MVKLLPGESMLKEVASRQKKVTKILCIRKSQKNES